MRTTHRATPHRALDRQELVLPSEIWIEIFRHATSVPFILDPCDTLEFSLTSRRDKRSLYRQSLITKRHLVRVCKQWNGWAMPFLYESIFLGRGRSLPALRDVLIRAFQKAGTPDEVLSLGWWTKRLDLALRDMGRTETEVGCISDIIGCLPNLSIINFAITALQFQQHVKRDELTSSILRSFPSSNLSKLRAVTCEGRAFFPDPDDWHAFLAGAVNIRALRCPNVGTDQRTPRVSLTSLEALASDDGDSLGELPSLRHLIADALPNTRSLFESLGSNLQVVQLHFFSTQPTVAHLLALLSGCCPKLSRLDISVTTWDFVGCQVGELVLPTTIRVFGLQNTSKQSRSQGYRNLFLGLEHMRYGSALDYIQLIDRGNVADLCQKHPRALARGLEMLERKGLELRDQENTVIRWAHPSLAGHWTPPA